MPYHPSKEELAKIAASKAAPVTTTVVTSSPSGLEKVIPSAPSAPSLPITVQDNQRKAIVKKHPILQKHHKKEAAPPRVKIEFQPQTEQKKFLVAKVTRTLA